MSNILKAFENRIATHKNDILLIAEGKEYTYNNFDVLINSIMQAVVKTECKRGDRAAIIIEEYDYFYASIFALWRLGIVAVPLNASLTNKQLQLLVDKADCKLLLSAGKFYDDITVSQKLYLPDINKLSNEKDIQYISLEENETAVIMFTSGTTGIPKGVVQTLYSESQNAEWTCERLALTEDDRIFINTPPYFTSGLSHFLTVINAGGSLAGYKGFVFGSDLLNMMKELGCSGFGGAPAHLIRVVETMSEPYEEESLNFWMSSGDQLPMSAIEKCQEYLPNVRLFNVYGLTEVSGRFCILQPEYLMQKNGSVGVPIGDMKATIVSAEGEKLSPGEIGEIHVGGSLLLKKYLDAPDITKKSIGKFGFKSGDFGYMDAEGFVYVEGRKDDIFKRGGEKVSTNKIKQVMLSLEIFEDVAVVAKDDLLMGKTPVACVVMKENEEFSKLKILKSLRNKIDNLHIPSNIFELEEIPRTGSGKAKKKDILEIVESKLTRK